MVFLVDGYGNKIRKLNTYESNATVGNPCLQYVRNTTLGFLKLINEGILGSAYPTVFTCITEEV